MTLSMRIWVVAGPILLVLLIAVTCYALSQIRILSIPIPPTLALLTIILPLFTGISSQFIYRLVRTYSSKPRLALYLLAIIAFQLIYETIIGTWAVNYIVPSCGLEEQWKRLYMNKDANAIQRIQDRFNCCGFNSVMDRAWPFPHGRPGDGFGAGQCLKVYGRERACGGPWRQAEQVNAGIFLTVPIVIFLIKAIIFILHFRNTSRTQSPGWMHSFNGLNVGDLEDHPQISRANRRGLIEGGDLNSVQEHYRDEVEDNQDVGLENGNSSRPRVEPSGLAAGDGGQQWREDM